MNIADAADGTFIINGDDLITEALAESGLSEFKDITPENATRKIAEFWSNTNKKPGDFDAYSRAIYQAYSSMTALADTGITVLSHSKSLLNNPRTPVALVITPSKSSVYANAQSDVLQIKERRAEELGARATKTHRVTDATNILDVLTGKEKLKNSKITVTDQNLTDQIDAITSLPNLYAMRYETSFMTNAQLADLGVTIDELSDLLDEKQKSLETKPNFDNIQKGDILIANDGTLLYVSSYEKRNGDAGGRMSVRPVGTKGKPEILTFSDYAKSIKAIFAKGMTIPETKPEITPEEQKTAEENIKASIADLDKNALREMEKDIDTDEDSALDEIDPC